MTCSLCKQPEVDSVEFEGGNNAEFSMTMRLCESHFTEYEKDELAFRDKHSELIDNECYEELLCSAEILSGE